MLSPRPLAPAPQPLLPVPGQVRDTVSSARVWFLDMGKAVQTPGRSRMTMPGQPQGPQPPWAGRILEHISGWGAECSHLHRWTWARCSV